MGRRPGYNKEWMRKDRVRHPQKYKDRAKEQNRKYRAAALRAYGELCVCCAEYREAFLVIDHINGGGTQHRKRIKRFGSGFYRWLKVQKYPEGFQVLCHNCNHARRGGLCPHQGGA